MSDWPITDKEAARLLHLGLRAFRVFLDEREGLCNVMPGQKIRRRTINRAVRKNRSGPGGRANEAQAMSIEKLGLRLYKHPKSGIYQIRGTYLGVAVDESAGTRVERDANGILERRRREIYEEVVLEKPRVRSFAEAAIGYMTAGGDKTRMPKILPAEIKVDGKLRVFGELMLNEIDQGVIDALATHLMPDVKDSTRNREVYTPVSAVLQYAADQASWRFSKGRIRRPLTPLGRIDWRTPKEVEWWLERAGPAKALITGYVGTGARASELINLNSQNVSPANHRITLWETDTKAARARGIDLQLRVRGALPQRPASGQGRVFLNSRGDA